MSNPIRHPNPGPTLLGRLLVGVLPVVLLSIFAVGFANYFVARAQMSGDVHERIRTLGEQVAVNITAFVEQRHRDLETLAETPLLVDYYKNVDYGLLHEAREHRHELQRYFATFANRTGVYHLVLYLDEDHNVVAGVRDGRVMTEERYEGPTIEHVQGWSSYRSPIFADGEHKRVLLAMPLRDVDDPNRERGMVVLVYSLSHVEQRILDEDARSYLIDSTDQVVLGAPSGDHADLRQEVAVEGVPWRVVVEANAAELLGPMRYLRDLTVFFSFAVGLTVSGILVLGIRRATRPLQEMAQGTRRLAAGDLAYRFPLPRTRELEALALSFNDMAEKLRARNEELESRIRQLTALRSMEGAVLQRLDEEAILRIFLRAVAAGLGFDRTGLYWVDEERGQIVGRYVHRSEAMGLSEHTFRQRSVPLGGDDILNQVVRTRQAVLSKDPTRTPGVDDRFVQESRTSEFVMAPLCGKDRVFGVITADNCYHGRELTEADKDALVLFASTAGLALENATLLQRLGESEARQRMVLDNSPIAILGLSREHRIITWNRGAENIFGYTADQIVGRPLADLFAEGGEEHLNPLMTKLIQQGSVREYPIAGVTADGERLELTLSWGGAEQDFWLNKEWAVVIRDVTESRKIERQLISSEKLSAVGQLIAGIAHELNNPLQAVVGYAQLLRQRSTDTAEREIGHIFENAQRCRKIIDNLLLFVRQGGVDKRPVAVDRAVRAALDLLAHRVRKLLRLKVELDLPESGPVVHANFQQLQQVFVNLLTNACDALEDWSGPRRLSVSVSERDGCVRAEVADSGPGVPEHVREHLFEPFFTTKPEGRGTGLGLPLCRQIIEEHAGRMGLTVGEEGGTTIWIELPLAEVGEAADEPEDGGPEAEVDGTDHSILLVEDEPGVRALLEDVLEAAGYQARSAESVEAAVACARQAPFDLVITDYQLEDGTGIELLERWGNRSRYPRPPFLLLTGNILDQELDRVCREHGLVALQKPVDLRELRARIRSLLAGEHPLA